MQPMDEFRKEKSKSEVVRFWTKKIQKGLIKVRFVQTAQDDVSRSPTDVCE